MISFYYIIREGVKESELQSKWNNSVQTHYVLAQVTFLNNIFWCASLIYKHRLPASKINNQADDFFFGSRCLINSDHLQMSRTKQNVCHLTFFSALCSFVVVAFSDFSIFVFMQLKSRTLKKEKEDESKTTTLKLVFDLFLLCIFLSHHHHYQQQQPKVLDTNQKRKNQQ